MLIVSISFIPSNTRLSELRDWFVRASPPREIFTPQPEFHPSKCDDTPDTAPMFEQSYPESQSIDFLDLAGRMSPGTPGTSIRPVGDLGVQWIAFQFS
jgi:hypothetical protein